MFILRSKPFKNLLLPGSVWKPGMCKNRIFQYIVLYRIYKAEKLKASPAQLFPGFKYCLRCVGILVGSFQLINFDPCQLIYFVYSVHILLLIELPLYFDFMYAIGLGYLAFNYLCYNNFSYWYEGLCKLTPLKKQTNKKPISKRNSEMYENQNKTNGKEFLAPDSIFPARLLLLLYEKCLSRGKSLRQMLPSREKQKESAQLT